MPFRKRCRFSLWGSMMNGMSFSETIFLFFLALIIFGPKKLPEIARQVGKFMNEFRRASNEFKAQIEQEVAHLEVEKKPTILPPNPVEGTTSRTWNTVEAEAVPTNPPATLTAPVDTPAPDKSDGAEPQPEVATEAAHPADALTSPSSQESHA
jgi:sec-independent protein translocase protein TatB